jgi:LCP family protein required for cell wall assembly
MKRRVLAMGAVLVAGWVTYSTVMADTPPKGAEARSIVAQIGRAGEARYLPGFVGRDPIFILAIGSDARPGYCEPVERCLADSLHLIGINPQRGAASILGIPRDSYVEIPGVGTRKINEALHSGGPQLVVETVEQVVGVDIDYYVLTSFQGFRHMVNSVGGLEVEVPYTVGASGRLPSIAAGPQLLDGDLALAFARNRKGVPNGDFSRSENQGLMILAALREFREDARTDAMSLFTWIVAGLRNIQSDLSAGEIFRLAMACLSVEPGNVVNRVVPGEIAISPEGASIVTLGEEANAVFADIAKDGLLSRSS